MMYPTVPLPAQHILRFEINGSDLENIIKHAFSQKVRVVALS
jgi:hypothetical protein